MATWKHFINDKLEIAESNSCKHTTVQQFQSQLFDFTNFFIPRDREKKYQSEIDFLTLFVKKVQTSNT